MDNDNDKKESIDPDHPWKALENILSREDGESFARAIEEAFPIEPVKNGESASLLSVDKTVHAETRRTRRTRRGSTSIDKMLKAEYDAAAHSLRLLHPLEGFADREKVLVTVEHADAKRPWSDLRGLLSGKEGEEFAGVIEEAFPIEPVKK
jgi:hypothetical protein